MLIVSRIFGSMLSTHVLNTVLKRGKDRLGAQTRTAGRGGRTSWSLVLRRLLAVLLTREVLSLLSLLLAVLLLTLLAVLLLALLTVLLLAVLALLLLSLLAVLA